MTQSPPEPRRAVGATLVAYAPQVLPSGPIEVASGIEVTKGQHRIRFTVIGTNHASLGHGFGVDCVETAALRLSLRIALIAQGEGPRLPRRSPSLPHTHGSATLRAKW